MNQEKRANGFIFLITVLVIILYLSIGLISTGCAQMPDLLDPMVSYKKDLQLEVGSRSGVGTLVASYAPSYNIEIRSIGELDWVTVASCHREMSFHNQGGWLGKNKMSFQYLPDIQLERDRACPLHIGVYSKKDGQHGWGWIDFEHPNLGLEASLSCNGERSNVLGVALCDARSGLRQRISFFEPVEVITKGAGCEIEQPAGNRIFLFNAKPGICLNVFYDIKTKDKLLRLTTHGYTALPVRN